MSNQSGAIVLGGTAQTIVPPSTYRKQFSLQNISAGDLWVRYDGQPAAVDAAGSFQVVAGAVFFLDQDDYPFNLISIVGATTGQKYSAVEVP